MNEAGDGRVPNVLSIAGSDPSGGAGVQADLKAFSACGAYGMAALTALTAQNTRGVQGVHRVPPAFVAEQIRAVFADVRVDAVKVGMVADAPIAAAVADCLAAARRDQPDLPVVVDPVMVAKGGAPLLSPDAVDTVRARLLPLATVITPNLPEALVLLGRSPTEPLGPEGMAALAAALLALGPHAVLLKGGHLTGADCPDLFVDHAGARWLPGARVVTRNTHGTGCTLSSILAALLARGGADLPSLVVTAKDRVAGAIAAADRLSVGDGHGPTHPLHALWRAAGLG